VKSTRLESSCGTLRPRRSPFFASAGPDKDASTQVRTPGNILLEPELEISISGCPKIREISRLWGGQGGGAWLAERDGERERERERETSTSKYGDGDEDG